MKTEEALFQSGDMVILNNFPCDGDKTSLGLILDVVYKYTYYGSIYGRSLDEITDNPTLNHDAITKIPFYVLKILNTKDKGYVATADITQWRNKDLTLYSRQPLMEIIDV